MSTKKNYIKRTAKTLGLEGYEVNELIKRMHRHFKKNGIDKEEITKAFFILQSIYERKEKIKLETTAPPKVLIIEIYKSLTWLHTI